MTAPSAGSMFAKTLLTFCDELRLTFPELGAALDRAVSTSPTQFWSSWKSHLAILLTRDDAKLFSERKGFLVGAVRLTQELWGEISGATKAAVWKYLRSLLLEAVLESAETLEAEAAQTVMAILTEERLEAGGSEAEAEAKELLEESFDRLAPLMDRLKGMMGGFMDLSGLENIPLPEIPEHLRNGRIAKLAEQLAKQIDPAEFGIDPATLQGDNVEEVLKRLAEIYQRDPTKLIAGAKRVAEKIKTQILGGSLDREALVAEAKEFVELFRSHPLFKEAIGKFETMMGGAEGLAGLFGSQSAGAPSARLQAVQERMRRKLAARQAAAGGGSKK